MQCVPPTDAELDDRQVDEPDEREDRAGMATEGRVVEGANQREMGEMQNEGRRLRSAAHPTSTRRPRSACPKGCRS
jgi:hypothetical protein